MEECRHCVLNEYELSKFRTTICVDHESKLCKNADACPNSHCLTWHRRNPYLIPYTPRLCPEISFVKKGSKMNLIRKCNRGRACIHAHSKEEELYHPLVYKTKICNSYPNCSRYFCPFAHTTAELRKPIISKSIYNNLQIKNKQLENYSKLDQTVKIDSEILINDENYNTQNIKNVCKPHNNHIPITTYPSTSKHDCIRQNSHLFNNKNLDTYENDKKIISTPNYSENINYSKCFKKDNISNNEHHINNYESNINKCMEEQNMQENAKKLSFLLKAISDLINSSKIDALNKSNEYKKTQINQTNNSTKFNQYNNNFITKMNNNKEYNNINEFKKISADPYYNKSALESQFIDHEDYVDNRNTEIHKCNENFDNYLGTYLGESTTSTHKDTAENDNVADGDDLVTLFCKKLFEMNIEIDAEKAVNLFLLLQNNYSNCNDYDHNLNNKAHTGCYKNEKLEKYQHNKTKLFTNNTDTYDDNELLQMFKRNINSNKSVKRCNTPDSYTSMDYDIQTNYMELSTLSPILHPKNDYCDISDNATISASPRANKQINGNMFTYSANFSDINTQNYLENSKPSNLQIFKKSSNKILENENINLDKNKLRPPPGLIFHGDTYFNSSIDQSNFPQQRNNQYSSRFLNNNQESINRSPFNLNKNFNKFSKKFIKNMTGNFGRMYGQKFEGTVRTDDYENIWQEIQMKISN